MQRHYNLKILIQEKFSGSQVDFSRRVGIQPAQVNQWLNGYRSLGEKSARKIEQSLGLKKYWLDGIDKNKDVQKADAQDKSNPQWDNDIKDLIAEFVKIADDNIRKEVISYVRGVAAASKLTQAKKSRRHSSTSPSHKKAA